MGASTVSTTFYTEQAADAVLLANNIKGGRVRALVIKHVTTAQEAASTINLCTLPKGAILIGAELHVEANAASSTMKLTYGSTDIAAAASTAAAVIILANLYALAGAAIETATDLKIVTAGATLTAGKAITAIVTFIMD